MNNVYITDGVRTPIGRYGGALSSVRTDDLAAHVIREIVSRNSEVDWEVADDVILGCANQAGEDNRNIARMALLLAGVPDSVSGTTINRLCASGADAVAMAARTIQTGDADLVIAGGVESMSRAPFVLAKSQSAFGRSPEIYDTTLGWRFVNPAMQAAYGTDSMGETAENVAEEEGVSRESQDAFAYRSQQRTAKAQREGLLGEEIIGVSVTSRKGETTTVQRDEHPRNVDLQVLARLPPAFREGGTVTAGNSSGVNDGAAVLLLASESAVERYGLRPIAVVRSAATSGVTPRLMGLGPIPATRRLLSRHGLEIADIDLIELNEAFAAQSIAVLRELGLPDDAEHVNPNGGAIALGHPLGMSGARLVLTAALELTRRGGERALVTMCVGVGQGIALLLERAG